jgi:hypothetical protein
VRYAQYKKLPEAFLHSLGLTEIRYLGAPAIRIPYRDRDSTEVAVRMRVIIPYAAALAELILPVAVRLRCDFGQLLALIKAHAILHQTSRDRDAEGRIVAMPHDYDVVRELVADRFAEGLGATVSPAVRETVEAVAALIGAGSTEVSVTQLAQALALDKSAASKRVSTAVQLGLLRNLEDRKERPARLCVGEPMPATITILPSIEVLHGCSVDRGDIVPPPPTVGERISSEK